MHIMRVLCIAFAARPPLRPSSRFNRHAAAFLSTTFTDRPPAPPPDDGSESTKKRHTLLTFGYCGTDYYGLQPQGAEGDPDKPTISDAIRKALLDEGFIAPTNFAPLSRTKWSLASRTDKGVHAACAAASVNLETLSDDLVEQEELIASGDPAAIAYEAKITAYGAKALSKGGVKEPPPQPEWRLSDTALQRLNNALPSNLKVFSGTRVRKRFDARDHASSRVYEYLLPLHAVGGTAAELDEVLRSFEGTHKMHNFASGLRGSHANAEIFRVEEEDDSLEWPLALKGNEQSSAAFRSVVTCRVHREVTIEGDDYLVLRIAGLAFVLHQIRHMVGAALAVTNKIVPLDVMRIALTSPLRVDISPLVPGCGLLLDQISWFSLKSGDYEARVPNEAREAMEAFKADCIYPHIHSLYQDGAYEQFLSELREGNYTKVYDQGDYEKLRRVHQAWKVHVKGLAERRRIERAERRAARAAAEEEEKKGEAKEKPSGPYKKSLGRRVPESLPGGLYVEVCKQYQMMPGPATHRAMELLRGKAARGEVPPGEPYQYYLDKLEEEGGVNVQQDLLGRLHAGR